MARYFFFRHPLEREDRPGRWPFLSSYRAETGGKGLVSREGFLNIDSKAPGVLNSNMDPCVFSDPLPWFLAHCRVDSIRKEHNRVLLASGGQGGLLSQEAVAGDVIFFGGCLCHNSEECRACKSPCKRGYLWIDTVFTVLGKVELPTSKGKDELFEHAIHTQEGYSRFRADMSEGFEIELPGTLSEFKNTRAWRFNLKDCLGPHMYVDYQPYYMLLARPEGSFIPLSGQERATCPLLTKRISLFHLDIETSGLGEVGCLLQDTAVRGLGVAELTASQGQGLMDKVLEASSARVKQIERLFRFAPSDLPSYGIRLADVITRLGYTQREVASWGEIQFASLNKIAKGKIPPTIRTLSRIAKILGVQIRDLVDEAEGSGRSFFHEIAKCSNVVKAKRAPASKNPCKRIHVLGSDCRLEDTPTPVPWHGSIMGARAVFIGKEPGRTWYNPRVPRFSEKWFPGKVEDFYQSDFARAKRIILDETVEWALIQGQRLFSGGDARPLSDIAVTYLCHCHGDIQGHPHYLAACMKRYGKRLLDLSAGLCVVAPECQKEVRALLRGRCHAEVEEDGNRLFFYPSRNEEPLLEMEGKESGTRFVEILSATRFRPRIVLYPKERDLVSMSSRWLDALGCYLSETGVRQLLPFILQDDYREKWARALFHKTTRCPEIRRFVRGQRENPCRELFFSYEAGGLEEIYAPLPWIGDIVRAKVLFVGLKAPLIKGEEPPCLDGISYPVLKGYVQRLIGLNKAPISMMKGMLAGLLKMNRTALDLLGQEDLQGVMAFAPVVNCRNRIKEGPFPVVVLRTCSSRYLEWKLAVSGANLVLIVGPKACSAVMDLCSINRDVGTGFVHVMPTLHKVMVFLPNMKSGIKGLAEEDEESIRPYIQQVRQYVHGLISNRLRGMKRSLKA